MKPVRKHISTRIFSRSLVGFFGKFPRGHGNYISVAENRNGHWTDVVTSEGFYQIVNLSAEDLDNAQRQSRDKNDYNASQRTVF